jgi:hypothetical protein
MQKQPYLQGFFLTFEFDSRVRLNYVFQEYTELPMHGVSEGRVWELMNLALKAIIHLQ